MALVINKLRFSSISLKGVSSRSGRDGRRSLEEADDLIN